MKKIVLSLAGVMAAMAFAPEASALPVFARQTGMACSACHFQHFPLLNGFGRAFKSAGYTMMGAQGKVEGEHLSIPNTLNLGVLTTVGRESTSASPNGAVAAYNNWFVPANGGELSIFFGGRIGEFAGFLSELGLQNANQLVGATPFVGVPTAKLLILPEVSGNTRAGVVAYTVGQGPAGSFELLNTGAVSIHRLMGRTGVHNMVAGARQYIAPERGATGLALVAVNPDFGFVNISKYASAAPGIAFNGASNLPGTYVRAAGMFDVAGWDSAVGFQSFSGNQASVGIAAGLNVPLGEEKATIIDGQAQGQVGSMPVGLYASYGRAPATATSVYNPGVGAATKTSFNIAGEVGIIPGVSTLQLAIRRANTPGVTLGATESDNAIMVGATYELMANMELSLTHTSQSGASWNAAGAHAGATGKTQTTLLLETLF